MPAWGARLQLPGNPSHSHGEVEGAALSGLALHPDPSAHHGHQPRGDGQAKAGAAESPAGRRVGLDECVEDGSLPVARDADSRVPDGEMQQQLICRPSIPRRTCTSTSPVSVNLMALPTRLIRTWRSRPGSPSTRSGTDGVDTADQLQISSRRTHAQCLQRHAHAFPDVEIDRFDLQLCRPRSSKNRGCR